MRRFENVGRIKVFLKDKEKKNILKIIKELLVLLRSKKEIPYYYFKRIYKKKITNYLDYLSTKEVVAIGSSKRLHKPEYVKIFESKLTFALFCESESIQSPQLIGYNLGKTFHSGDEEASISSKDEFYSFLKNTFKSFNVNALFFRPHSEFGGKGCFKLTKDFSYTEADIAFKKFNEYDYVFTECIEQHEAINKIHSKSINTLRFISLITSDDNIKILCAFMRFGIGNNIVDNASSGGFFVGIDKDKGTLDANGLYMLEYGGNEILEHPDSGFKFEGFKIPYYNEACELIINSVKKIPNRFIGWDIAITNQGPTIIEANSDPHIFLSDYAYGGLLKDQDMQDLIAELKSEEPYLF